MLGGNFEGGEGGLHVCVHACFANVCVLSVIQLTILLFLRGQKSANFSFQQVLLCYQILHV